MLLADRECSSQILWSLETEAHSPFVFLQKAEPFTFVFLQKSEPFAVNP